MQTRIRDITDWLPGGTGHVLITSRARSWHEVALPVDVSVLDRRESVEMLHRRVSSLPEADADEVAEAAGDLPLAVAQAAGYIAETAIPAAEYADLLRGTPAEALADDLRLLGQADG
jgi:hypothetical protein